MSQPNLHSDLIQNDNNVKPFESQSLPKKEVHPYDVLHQTIFTEPLNVVVDSDGRKRYYNPEGEERKMVPRKNKLFQSLMMKGMIISEEQKLALCERTKESMKKEKGIDPGSAIYNYFVSDIYILAHAYEKEISADVQESIKKKYRKMTYMALAWKNAFIMTAVFTITTYSRTWSKLTSNNKNRLFLMGLLGMNWSFYDFHKSNQRLLNIFEYHQEWEKVIRSHEKEQNIHNLL